MAEKGDRKRDDVPSTVERSGDKAVRTWTAAHDSAVESYGEGERAHRTAFAALKHTHEKVGDHWEPKERPGPSDDQAASGGAGSRDGGSTAGGVDANASKRHLEDVARRVGVEHPGKLKKADLVEEIDKANRRETAKAREREKGS